MSDSFQYSTQVRGLFWCTAWFTVAGIASTIIAVLASDFWLGMTGAALLAVGSIFGVRWMEKAEEEHPAA